MEACVDLKHSLMRCTRECLDVEFLSMYGDMTQETKELCAHLGVDKFPTLQFWREGAMLWQQAGGK